MRIADAALFEVLARKVWVEHSRKETVVKLADFARLAREGLSMQLSAHRKRLEGRLLSGFILVFLQKIEKDI